MSRDPKRWRDDEVDPEIAELLGAMPPPRAMTARERTRTAQRVARMLALPVAATTALWFKALAYAAAIGATAAVTATIYLAQQDEPAPMEAPVESAAPFQAPSPEAQESPPPAELPSASPAEEVPPPVPVPTASASASPADTLQREAALLERARAKIGSDPAGALVVLNEHAREFPRGQLTMEREMLLIDALARAGRHSEAHARARALLARSPGGLYEKRLKKILGQQD